MNRLLCFSLLFFLFTSPAHTQEVLPQEPLICTANSCSCSDGEARTYTIRTPNIDYYDFLRAADAMVLAAAPDWYVVGTQDLPIVIQASPNLLGVYGEAWLDDQGVYHVVIGRLGLMLATVEDMASVMLHEFVHVVEWKKIEAEDWSENCKAVRQELIANKVVIEHYLLLGYTPYMLDNSRVLYSQARVRGILNQCPAEVTSDLPEIPTPIKPEGPQVSD